VDHLSVSLLSFVLQLVFSLEKNPAANLGHPVAEVVTALLGMTAHLLPVFLILESQAAETEMIISVINLPFPTETTNMRYHESDVSQLNLMKPM
jgi:hypothetical protein